MKLLDLSPENRPRERLARQGPSSLSDAELLALILKSGTQKENILEICNKLLSKYQLPGLAQATLSELKQEHGIGAAKASQLVALFELLKRTSPQYHNSPEIKCAQDIAKIYLPKMQSLTKEHFMVVYLNTKHKIISDQLLSLGTLNASLIHPREVFYGAIKNLASSIIVIHNHPSGDPQPSSDDMIVTEKIQKTGEIMGISLLDHIIIGRDNWWSWKESAR